MDTFLYWCSVVFCVLVFLVYLKRFWNVLLVVLETISVTFFNKPLFVPFVLFPKKLNPNSKLELQKHSFYDQLKPNYKILFEHRVARFIKNIEFIERDITISDAMKIKMACEYIKLTFGLRIYKNPLVKRILIYPDVYRSENTKQLHKGEFNPGLRTLVFSWNDFEKGLAIENDNLNLGLHEFTHALHIFEENYFWQSNVLFKKNLKSIFKLFSNPVFKEKFLKSEYFRAYALENKFEFTAVILEHFFESPLEFQKHFPEMYVLVKQMINYNENRFKNS